MECLVLFVAKTLNVLIRLWLAWGEDSVPAVNIFSHCRFARAFSSSSGSRARERTKPIRWDWTWLIQRREFRPWEGVYMYKTPLCQLIFKLIVFDAPSGNGTIYYGAYACAPGSYARPSMRTNTWHDICSPSRKPAVSLLLQILQPVCPHLMVRSIAYSLSLQVFVWHGIRLPTDPATRTRWSVINTCFTYCFFCSGIGSIPTTVCDGLSSTENLRPQHFSSKSIAHAITMVNRWHESVWYGSILVRWCDAKLQRWPP
jgi:hypothetical protein